MKNYFMGLDIGTDSVGWAVTDTDYSVMKFRGNAMWGIRLFDQASTAEERRVYRSQRKRTQRKKFRIKCLQMLFDSEISKRDVAFFQRLRESNLYAEDKSVAGKFSVFNDSDFTDKDYHKKYPTVYHLRKELIESSEAHDVRLVYLAVSHIIKNRGHFLFDSQGLGAGEVPSFSDVWNELAAHLKADFDADFYLDDYSRLEKVLKTKTTITNKKSELFEIFSISKKDKFEAAALSLLAGAKVKSVDLFGDDLPKDSEVKAITFAADWDSKAAEYEAAFSENFETVELLKAVYDWAILADILNGQSYISFAKCDIYNKHSTDLKLLKRYVKEYIPEKYNLIFNENKKGTNNYLAYSKGYIDKNHSKKCSQSDFCDFLKKVLPKECLADKYKTIYSDLETGSFMPKAVSKDNSVIPMQIHFAELKAILNNAKEYLPFLNDRDENGKSVSDKICDIFSFRIPYYVGPLNSHSDKAWLERGQEKIYPWNFNRVVDTDKSAEKFINNLTSKCTYIHTEDVLPKYSLLYSQFMVLNELNNLKIDARPITAELKQQIYNEMFLKRNKVTRKGLEAYLKSNGVFGEVSGIDGDFKSCLKSEMDLRKYNLTFDEKEEIIRAVTIFGDDKKLLKKRLKAQFGAKLTAEEIAQISRLKYSGWGRLSKKFLNGIWAVQKNENTGEADTVIGFMFKTNNNLMQLLSSHFTFCEEIERLNSGEFTTLKEEVDALYISPQVKRPVYQSMQIIDEIVKINKCAPKKIFIEVARGEEAKKRTVSRKSKLLELYKACKKDNEELYESLLATDENAFRRDALYLYYTQFGRCMYTGEQLDVSELFNRNLYDIEHIFPRSKIKDDSLDNRVLVKKTINEEKGNDYPIKQEIRAQMRPFWTMLRSKGLISQKKFERLVRNHPLSDDELSDFISRQLVETRQSTKAVAELLKKRYPNSKIVYVKASIVSDFRQKYELPKKCRDVNDLHHAKDAYLNIVAGNVYDVKYTSRYFISELQSGKCSLNKMFDRNINGAWVADGGKSLCLVKKTMLKNNIRFTRYSYKQYGGLFDQTVLAKGYGQVPIKKGMDIEKYGGYNKAAATYFAFFEYTDKRGQKARAFEPVDLYIEKEYRQHPEKFIAAALNKKQKLNLTANDIKILVPCVKINTLISIDGFRMHISGKGGGGKRLNLKPAVQLVLGSEKEAYIKTISNYLQKCKELNCIKEITKYDGVSADENIELYNALADKMTDTVYSVKFENLGNNLKENVNVFESLAGYEQCCVIMQILNILHANALKGDLTLVNLSKNSGELAIVNKVQPNVKSFKIISQSITGLFEKEIDLLK